MTREITLSRDRGIALVDDADYGTVAASAPWHALQCGPNLYARHSFWDPAAARVRVVKMHTLITGWDYVDHINGNGLDNRRANLRAATHALNMANKRIYSNNTSGFKGVYPGPRGKWLAKCGSRYLGSFSDLEDAARAYDDAAIAAWGEFARPNFPQQEPAA